MSVLQPVMQPIRRSVWKEMANISAIADQVMPEKRVFSNAKVRSPCK
jgi:hypothetical protein